MDAILKVTAKGQVTLRKELLDHLGVAPGEKIAVDFVTSGRAEIRSAKSKGSIKDFIGCLHEPGTKALSVDGSNEIAASGWAGGR